MEFRVSNPPGPGVPQGGKRNPNDIDEPSVSNNGRVVFYTGNWYASESNDSGDTWTFVNPITIDPNFCCDQHTIYDPVNNITIWEMLSLPDRTTGVNHVKLLVANGQAGVSGNLWHSFDLTTSLLVAPANSWLDYPQLGLSQNNLFLTLNGFRGTAPDFACTSPATACAQLNSYVIRMPLVSLAAGGTLPFDFKTYDCTKLDCVDTFTPVQQVGATMYFGAHGGLGTAIAPVTTVLRVYEWPDNFSSTQPLVEHDVPDPTGFTYMIGQDGFCPSNGWDVCQRDDSRVHAGWWQPGELDFAWDARQDSSAQFPYVRGAKVSTATWTLTRFDLALATAATIYPGIAVNARGGLGVTMVVAGGPHPSPQALIGISDDLTSGWELHLLQDGTGNPALNGWGDYLTIRPASGTGNSWVATGFTVQGSAVQPIFAWFGRSRDDPFTATGLTCGTAITGAMGAQTPGQVLATFTATSGALLDYVATIDWGDGSTPSRVIATGSATAPNGAIVSATHAFSSAGNLTVTVTIGPRVYSGVSVSCTLPATITGSVYTTATTNQYQLRDSDGSSWLPIDPSHLVLNITPPANSTAIVSANADLWTQNAGINQDIGVAVSGGTGPGSYPTVAGQPEAWKESGGFAGTFSPNAAYLQTAIPMNAGTTYTITLVWKANKPAAGTTIMAGAGPLPVALSVPQPPIPPSYSPARLTAQLIPDPRPSPNPNFAQKAITTQRQLQSSNGSTWQDMDSDLSQSFMAPADGTLVIGGNADLWTATAGYNQDLGVTVSGGGVYPSVAGQPEAWKESGGYGGTQSPNAAFVQAAVPVKNGVSYQVKLQWKTNRDARSSGAIIVAGAGPIGTNFSPTTMTIQFFASANVVNAAVTSQPVNPGSNGFDFTPIDSNNLSGSIPSSNTADCVAILGGNADLWTANAGYNQDIAIWVNGNLLGWKESGGFAGTFSPNAAFVQSVIPIPMGSAAPGFILQWKTNIDATSSGARIYAGAGPIGVRFSPTRLSAEIICS